MVLEQTAQAQSCVGTATFNVTIQSCVPTGIPLKIRALLQGPYDPALLQMSVPANYLLNVPTSQPYYNGIWAYNGLENISNKPTNLIDWVLIELRSASDINSVIAQKAALLLSDGSIVDPTYADNNSIDAVYMNVASGTSAYVVVRHRNHIAIISQNTVALPNAATLDLTTIANVMGTNQQLYNVGSGRGAMLSGDWNADGVITVADFNGYIAQSAAINGYLKADFELDNSVTVSDFNLYLPNSSKIGTAAIRY